MPKFEDKKIVVQQSGFTLIELLLYVSIAGAMLLVVSLFLSVLLQGRVRNQVIAEVDQQGAQVMQLITQTIRNSASITSPTIGSSGATLILALSAPSQNPSIFDLSGSTLRLSEGSPAVIYDLTNSRVTASSLIFSNLSYPSTSGLIRVQFTLTYINPENKVDYNYTKIFYGSAVKR